MCLWAIFDIPIGFSSFADFSFSFLTVVTSDADTEVWHDTEEMLSSGATVPATDIVRLTEGVGGKLPVPSSSISAVQLRTLLKCAPRSAVASERGNVVSVRADKVGDVGRACEGGCDA